MDQDFVELSTPLLVKNPGLEPYLKHFKTEFVGGEMSPAGKTSFYLPTSPEYHLKKALANYGFEKVFEIAKTFRNGETSPLHEAEFLMLEWYRSPGTYNEIANDFGALLSHLGSNFSSDKRWSTPNNITVVEAFFKYANLDLVAEMKKRKENKKSFEEWFSRVIVEKIEPKLGFNGPTFLWDYPKEFAALSRAKPENPDFCERFEVYWKGIELANAFGELTDSAEQHKRCLEDIQARMELYGDSPEVDLDFIHALSKLPPNVGGIAVGVDRLVQCLLECSNIQEVIAFPGRFSV